MATLSETARGRWHGILPQLGISPKVLRNRHGPCPICGGKDRFRFDDKEGKGTWICNRCGSGDGAELVKRVKRVEFREAAKMIENASGGVSVRAAKSYPIERDRNKLNQMWRDADPLTEWSMVGQYLLRRCGLKSFPRALRQSNSTMLARVTDSEGKPVTIHRTILSVPMERKLMPGKLPDNVAIRLAPVAGRTLGIAEGIETALSASALFEVPVWAAISAPLLRKWRPPEGVEKVIVFGDNDKSFTGQEAAYRLAWSIASWGGYEVEVKIPTLLGQDWNDVHREIMAKA